MVINRLFLSNEVLAMHPELQIKNVWPQNWSMVQNWYAVRIASLNNKKDETNSNILILSHNALVLYDYVVSG